MYYQTTKYLIESKPRRERERRSDLKGGILPFFHCLLQCLFGDLPRSRRAVHFPSLSIDILLVVLVWRPLVYVDDVLFVLAPASPSLPVVSVVVVLSLWTSISKPFPRRSLRLVLSKPGLPLCIISAWLLISSPVFIAPFVFSECFPLSWSVAHIKILWLMERWISSPRVGLRWTSPLLLVMLMSSFSPRLRRATIITPTQRHPVQFRYNLFRVKIRFFPRKCSVLWWACSLSWHWLNLCPRFSTEAFTKN